MKSSSFDAYRPHRLLNVSPLASPPRAECRSTSVPDSPSIVMEGGSLVFSHSSPRSSSIEVSIAPKLTTRTGRFPAGAPPLNDRFRQGLQSRLMGSAVEMLSIVRKLQSASAEGNNNNNKNVRSAPEMNVANQDGGRERVSNEAKVKVRKVDRFPRIGGEDGCSRVQLLLARFEVLNGHDAGEPPRLEARKEVGRGLRTRVEEGVKEVELEVFGVLGEVANSGLDAHVRREGGRLEGKDVVSGEVLLFSHQWKLLRAEPWLRTSQISAKSSGCRSVRRTLVFASTKSCSMKAAVKKLGESNSIWARLSGTLSPVRRLCRLLEALRLRQVASEERITRVDALESDGAPAGSGFILDPESWEVREKSREGGGKAVGAGRWAWEEEEGRETRSALEPSPLPLSSRPRSMERS